jgi:hypothetical protein
VTGKDGEEPEALNRSLTTPSGHSVRGEKEKRLRHTQAGQDSRGPRVSQRPVVLEKKEQTFIVGKFPLDPFLLIRGSLSDNDLSMGWCC